MVRIVFLRCLIVFILITIVGLVLMHVYNDRMATIETNCGLHANPVNKWGAFCAYRYSRGHIGRLIWWGPVLTVGAAGTLASLIALVIVQSKALARP